LGWQGGEKQIAAAFGMKEEKTEDIQKEGLHLYTLIKGKGEGP